MDVGCPQCQTEYELDDTRVPEDGVTVKCTSCSHVFRVKRKSLIVLLPVRADDARARAASAPDDLPPPPPSREWKLRQPTGRTLVCRELTTLQKWIIENKVAREDEISLTGETWKRLGEIPELASFFEIVDEAAKARTLEAIHSPTPVPMTPMSALPPGRSSRPSGALPAPGFDPPRTTSRPSGSLPAPAFDQPRPPSRPSGALPALASRPSGTLPAPASRPSGALPAPASRPSGTLPAPASRPSGTLPAPASRPSGTLPAPASDQARPASRPSGALPEITQPALPEVSQQPPPPPPPSLPPQPAPSQQRKEEFARRYEPTESALKKAVGSSESSKGKWGVLIALLAAGAAVAYYFGVYEPQQYQQVTSIPAAAAPVQVEAHEPAPTTAPLDAAVVVDAGADTDAGEGDAGPLEAPAAAPVDAGPSPGMPIDAGAAIAVAAPVEVIDAGHRVAEPKRSFDNLLAQADSLRERERFEAAMNLYGQAHEMRPDRVEPLAGRGLSLLDLGHAAAAEAAFEQALKLNSRYGPAIMGLAEALRTQGNKARAIEFYQRYLDVLPNGVEASVARNNIERLKK